MIVNQDKFQAMIMRCDEKVNKHDLNINNSNISSVYSATLLGIETNQFNFEKHISTIYKKWIRQLNTISRIISYERVKVM